MQQQVSIHYYIVHESLTSHGYRVSQYHLVVLNFLYSGIARTSSEMSDIMLCKAVLDTALIL